MGTQKSREFKLHWLSARINQAERENVVLNKEKLLGTFALTCSSTIRTGNEILDVMKSADKIIIEGNNIYPKSVYDAEMVLRKNALQGNNKKGGNEE